MLYSKNWVTGVSWSFPSSYWVKAQSTLEESSVWLRATWIWTLVGKPRENQRANFTLKINFFSVTELWLQVKYNNGKRRDRLALGQRAVNIHRKLLDKKFHFVCRLIKILTTWKIEFVSAIVLSQAVCCCSASEATIREHTRREVQTEVTGFQVVVAVFSVLI